MKHGNRAVFVICAFVLGIGVFAPLSSAQSSESPGVENGDFETGTLAGWTNSSSSGATASVTIGGIAGSFGAELAPSDSGTARIEQIVEVTPDTAYSITARIEATAATNGVVGVRGFDGRWSQLEDEGRVEFHTGSGTSEVLVYLQVWKRQAGSVRFDDVVLADSSAPPEPTPEPPGPGHEPAPIPEGDNLVANSEFDEGSLAPWTETSSKPGLASLVGGLLALAPTTTDTARVEQRVAVEELTEYRLAVSHGLVGSALAYAGVGGYDGRWSQIETLDNATFTTGADVNEVTVYVQAWKQQAGVAYVDAVALTRSDAPAPPPTSAPPTSAPPTSAPPTSAPPTSAPPTSAPPAPGTNLARNGGFESALSGWSEISGTISTTSTAYEGESALRLASAPGSTARVEQVVSGLKPETLYTLALRTKTAGVDAWASYGVETGTQAPKTNSVRAATFSEKRFIFYTDTTSDSVSLFLQAYESEQGGTVLFDDIRIVQGRLPAPDPDPGQDPWPTPPALPGRPSAGENLISNAGFDAGTDAWVIDRGEVSGGLLTLSASATETARAVQDIPVSLAPASDYLMRVNARAGAPGPTVGVVLGDTHAYETVTSDTWVTHDIAFTTPAEYVTPKILLESWKGNTGQLFVDSIELIATGGEWLDTPSPVPAVPGPLHEDFSGPLDSDKWLIVDRAWGGDNGGLIPENVSIDNGVLRLEAHGDTYTGTVAGHGGRTTRVGAGIATRAYFASGEYTVRARLPQELGVCSAFWSFHYIEKFPSEPGYWDEPNRIRNTEIDWEFPTDVSNGTMHDPISYSKGRANSWGGKFGGEGAHHPGRVEFGSSLADGEFHDFGIEWHSGDDGSVPRVIWKVDGTEVYRHVGATFGQDNIPFRAARFWIGAWFPASGYKERVDGQRVDRVGWAGDPNFDTAVLEIDSVTITPFHEANDTYEAETWPNGWYATPDEYPL